MTAPGGRGETAGTYHAHSVMQGHFALMAELFRDHPKLVATSVCIKGNHVEILADGSAGVVKEWAHALPDHREIPGWAPTSYGGTEAVVLEQDSIQVTIRPPVGGLRA